ncbi:MAG: HAD-IA family hydrolase [Thermoleophilum sp.]|nr:HAD-IA family hydrolase [Thermoleophilum sp.]
MTRAGGEGLPDGTELVVLDLDGTLARLDVDWAQLRKLANERGRALLGAAAPVGVLATLRALAARGHRAAACELEAVVAQRERAAAARCALNAALCAWLEREAAGLPLAVLTLNDAAAARTALARAGLEDRVVAVVGRGDAPSKPDPTGLFAIVDSVGSRPERALLIGDSEVDAECAFAAGARFRWVEEIGCAWTCGDLLRA